MVIDNGVAIAITIENLKKTKQNKTTTISKQNEVFVFKFSLFCSCLVGWLVQFILFQIFCGLTGLHLVIPQHFDHCDDAYRCR